MTPRVVLVTGVSRFLGGATAHALASDTRIERVIGVDLSPAHSVLTTHSRAEFVRADIRSPLIAKVIDSAGVDTVVHTAISTLHLVLTRGPRDVILCNAANAPVLVLLRLFRRRVVLNVDGLEWRRSKWGVAGRAWYRMGEWLSVRLASVRFSAVAP